jgi:hypothetical protein
VRAPLQRLKAMLDLGLFDVAPNAVAACAARERNRGVVKVEAPEDLSELITWGVVAHAKAVRDDAALEQAAIANEQGAVIGRGDLGQFIAAVIIAVKGPKPYRRR